MLLLQKGINQIYVTVSELNTINNPIYYIAIKDETTKETKNVYIIDTSIYADRYNQFQIELVDDINDEDLSNGIVCLNTGKHTYTIYSTDLTDTINCENGIIKVLRYSIPIGSSYTDTLPTQEYGSYTGNIDQNI